MFDTIAVTKAENINNLDVGKHQGIIGCETLQEILLYDNFKIFFSLRIFSREIIILQENSLNKSDSKYYSKYFITIQTYYCHYVLT